MKNPCNDASRQNMTFLIGVLVFAMFSSPTLWVKVHAEEWEWQTQLSTCTDSNNSCEALVNTAPVLNPIGDQVVNQGDTLFFTVTATDAEDDVLEFSLFDAPADAYIDPYTGEFYWIPDSSGYFGLTITVVEAYATSSTSFSDEETIIIHVTEPMYSDDTLATEHFENDEEQNLLELDNSVSHDEEGEASETDETDDENWESAISSSDEVGETDDENWESTISSSDETGETDDENWENTIFSSEGNTETERNEFDNMEDWIEDDWQNSLTPESNISQNEASETFEEDLAYETLPSDTDTSTIEEMSNEEQNVSIDSEQETIVVSIDNMIPQNKSACLESEEDHCQKPTNQVPVFNNIGNPSINLTVNIPENESNTDNYHLLTVITVGSGFGTISSEGIDCGVDYLDCTEYYPTGTAVALTANPDMESRFVGWTGDCKGSSHALTVMMNSAFNCIAIFELAFEPEEAEVEEAEVEEAEIEIAANESMQSSSLSSYKLQFIKVGTGHGNVSSTLNDINCGIDCEENYLSDTVVTLTATPETGSRFIDWGGDCHHTDNPMTVTIKEAMTCTALFNAIPQHRLTVNKTGHGTGMVTASVGLNSGGIDCGSTCAETYYQSSLILLTATPTAESTFVGWQESGCQKVFKIKADMNCTAIFEQIPSHTLTLTTAGDGNGSILYTAGIDCGLNCVSYLNDTEVTITAKTETDDTRFTGWSGDCSGTETAFSFIATNNMSCIANFDSLAQPNSNKNEADEVSELNEHETMASNDTENVIEDTSQKLPQLSTAIAFNAQGETVNTDAHFAGGISINGNLFEQMTTISLSDSDLVNIRGGIWVDSGHIGQLIDIIVVVAMPASVFDTAPLYFMLDSTGNFVPWDVDIASLVHFKTVGTIAMPIEVPIYSGSLTHKSILSLYFGYRIADGTLVYSPQSIDVTITE